MQDNDRYAIGQQDFKTLRERDAIYVDKTAFVEMIARSKVQYYFLARPRRFGKSLFLSTLRYFYEGQRSLFKGLYIDSTNWDWEPYPVLHLDLNTEKFDEPGMLEGVLNSHFRNWEKKYEIEVKDTTYSQRFSTIIKTAHEKTGRRVVILVDEYDKPLVDNLNNIDLFKANGLKLANIFTAFKCSAEHIRLVFMTGSNRYFNLRAFSDLNLDDISFDNEFSNICGFTENELLENLRESISNLAYNHNLNFSDACHALKLNYDGYCFTPEGEHLYHPWLLLNCLEKGRIESCWNYTDAGRIISEALHEAEGNIEKLVNAEWSLSELACLEFPNPDPTAVLFQAGFLSITDYNVETDSVRLKIPNEQVRKLFNIGVSFSSEKLRIENWIIEE